MKKLRIAVAALAIMMAGTAACSADSIHDSINRIGVDRFAHVGVSYIINDQLKRNAHLNPFWAATTTLAIGAAKEAWIDDHFDRGDFAADCVGVLMYQIRF